MKMSLAAPKSVSAAYSSSGSTKWRLSTFALACRLRSELLETLETRQRDKRLGDLALACSGAVAVRHARRR